LRRLLLLVRQDERPANQRDIGQDPFLDLLHRRQSHLLPDAFPGIGRYAAPHQRLSRGLRRLEHGGVDRRLHLFRLDAVLRVYRLLHAARRAQGRGQPVGPGRHHPRMDALLAAALPYLRGTAAAEVASRRAPTSPSRCAGPSLSAPRGGERAGVRWARRAATPARSCPARPCDLYASAPLLPAPSMAARNPYEVLG